MLEVKSATLVKNGKALFPDAPTIRGAKHVKELRKALDKNFKSIIVFLVKRDDANILSPNAEIDPDFTKELEMAKEEGVIIIAAKCRYDPIEKMELSHLSDPQLPFRDVP